MSPASAKPDRPVEPLRLVKVTHPTPRLLESLELYDLQAFGPLGLRRCDLAVMAKAGWVCLAYSGEDIVGGCQLIRMMDEPDMLYMVGFYILAEWQGRHLGRTFLLAIAEQARSSGARGLVLTVSPENRQALALYRSVGFVQEELVTHFYGKDEDRQVLRWVFGGGT